MSPVGVDEWVARSAERGEVAGWRGVLARADRRIGWWPRLAAVTILGLAFAQLSTNVNIQTVAFNSLLYATLAMGLNIAVGWSGLLDLGYIAFFGFGAYGYAIFSSSALGNGGSGGVHLAGVETIVVVVVAAGLVGVVLGLIALRLSGDYFAIVTLFVGQAFYEIVNNLDPGTLGGVNGLFGLDTFHSFGMNLTTPLDYYYLALAITVLVAAVLHLLDTSRTGRAWRALNDDPLAAEAMTIPVNKMKVMAFSFAAMVGALAGTMFAAQQGSTFPTNFTINILIIIYACLVLGGTGTIAGAILGGIVITVAQNMLSSPTDAAYLFYGLILLIIVVRVRPWQKLAARAGRDRCLRVRDARDRRRDRAVGHGRESQLARLDRVGAERIRDRPGASGQLRQRAVHRDDRRPDRDRAAQGDPPADCCRGDGVHRGVLLGVAADR